MRFDHAGIAVTDADELAALYVDLLGVDVAHEGRVDGMIAAMGRLGTSSRVPVPGIDRQRAGRVRRKVSGCRRVAADVRVSWPRCGRFRN